MNDNIICDITIGDQTITMDGKALTSNIYKIISIEGLSASDYEVNIVPSGQNHGGRVSGKRIAERMITIEGRYRGPLNAGDVEEWLIGFFSPLKAGHMVVHKNGVSRYIDFDVQGFQVKRENIGKPLKFQVILIAAKPFFKDINEFADNMASRINRIRAPFVIKPYGLVASVKRYNQEARITNKGHKDTGIRIEIKVSGKVVNPRIDNLTTGQYIKVNTILKNGDVLLINTNKGETDITLNGVSITNLKDRGSRYFRMEPGDNVLKYNADEGYMCMDVFPRHTPEYLGV